MNLGLALLTAVASAVSVGMALAGLATWLEAVSFVTGALCVWLTVKESAWNFPLGLANVATFSVVFFRSQLFADASLQVVYFVLGVIGWWMWLYGGENRTRLTVTRATTFEISATATSTVVATIAIWQLLRTIGGTATFFDALTTSISLASQWLLNRKRLEAWIGWIIVDILYVPLYIYKELYLTAILYAVFLAMALFGLRAWRKSWLTESACVHPGSAMKASDP